MTKRKSKKNSFKDIESQNPLTNDNNSTTKTFMSAYRTSEPSTSAYIPAISSCGGRHGNRNQWMDVKYQELPISDDDSLSSSSTENEVELYSFQRIRKYRTSYQLSIPTANDDCVIPLVVMKEEPVILQQNTLEQEAIFSLDGDLSRQPLLATTKTKSKLLQETAYRQLLKPDIYQLPSNCTKADSTAVPPSKPAFNLQTSTLKNATENLIKKIKPKKLKQAKQVCTIYTRHFVLKLFGLIY